MLFCDVCQEYLGELFNKMLKYYVANEKDDNLLTWDEVYEIVIKDIKTKE